MDHQATSAFRLLGFLLKSRARMMFTGDENDLINVGRFFVVLLVLFYAGSAAIIMITVPPDLSNLAHYGILASIASMLAFSQYFPSVKFPSKVIPKYSPVAAHARGMLNFLYDVFRPTVLYILLFLFITNLIAWSTGPYFFIDGLVVIVTVFMVDYSIKYLLFYRNSSLWLNIFRIVAVILLFVLFMTVAILYNFETRWAGSMALLLILAASILALTLISRSSGDVAMREKAGSRSAVTSVAQAARISYNRRKSTRPVYLFILLLNSVFAFYLYMISVNDAHSYVRVMFLLMLNLPIIPFSYVHANYFGFFRETWLEIRLRNGKLSTLFQAYIGSMIIPVLVDAVVTFGLLYALDEFTFARVLIYLFALPITVLFAMWASYRFPRIISSFFSLSQISGFKNNTSGVAGTIAFVITVTLALLIYYDYLLIGIIYTLLMCALLFYLTVKADQNLSLKLYDKLFGKK